MKKSIIALSIILVTYFTMVIPVMLWPVRGEIIDYVCFWMYNLLALTFAVDLTENLLALAWRPMIVNLSPASPPRHKVAVLMTICDDWSEECLQSLTDIADANYEIFLLDDSVHEAPLPASLRSRVRHLRRPTNLGAKAGNLNSWLRLCGRRFSYAVILDADSKMTPEAIDKLVRAAEHPLNSWVAIFQAKIEPEKPSTVFSNILGIGARSWARVLERVHAHLGILLSFGHNQLLRLQPVYDLGGFDEEFTCEDTVISLRLAEIGWSIALVDIWSVDSEPLSINRFTRRTVRWGRQTVELFSCSWYGVPLRLKVLLCRHLLSYIRPIVACALLLHSLFTSSDDVESSMQFSVSALNFERGYVLYGITMWYLFALFVLSVVLRSIIAWLEGVSLRRQFLDITLGGCPYVALLLPLTFGMLSSAFGNRTPFKPTNSRLSSSKTRTIQSDILMVIGPIVLFVLIIIGVWCKPGSMVTGLNSIWLVLTIVSILGLPVIVFVDRMYSVNCADEDENQICHTTSEVVVNE